MPSVFQRIGTGLGKAAETYGKISLEEQRQARLKKFREQASKKDREFRSSEAEKDRKSRDAHREDQQQFTAAENAKLRSARLESTAQTKPIKVKSERLDEETGMTVLTMEDGTQRSYDPETDTYTELGKGKPKVSEASMDEDKEWARKQASSVASYFSSDETDFPIFKSEERAAEAAAQFRNNARAAGKLREFETNFAKEGWTYIQNLAQADSSGNSGVITTTSTQPSRIDNFVSAATSRGMSEKDVLEALLKDPRAKDDHDEIRRRLKEL